MKVFEPRQGSSCFLYCETHIGRLHGYPPGQHMRDLITEEKWHILNEQLITSATTVSPMNNPSTILVIPQSSIPQFLFQTSSNINQRMSYTNVVFQQHITRSVNRDQIQHQRIDDRVGFQTRFQTAGNLIFKAPQESSLAITEAERFNKNHQVNDKIKREADKGKTDAFYNARLQKRLSREQEKWVKQGDICLKEEQKRIYQQKVQIANNKNTNGMGYNPITHDYEQSIRGNKLRAHDESKQVNRHVRTMNIVDKNGAGFNIITGQSKGTLQQNVPQKLRQRVELKYENKKQREAVKFVPKRDKYDYLDD